MFPVVVDRVILQEHVLRSGSPSVPPTIVIYQDALTAVKQQMDSIDLQTPGSTHNRHRHAYTDSGGFVCQIYKITVLSR